MEDAQIASGLMRNLLQTTVRRADVNTRNLSQATSHATLYRSLSNVESSNEDEELRRFERMQMINSASSFLRTDISTSNAWLFENIMNSNYEELISRPPPVGQRIQCKIVRRKKGQLGGPEFEYEAYFECNNGTKMFLLGAVRKPGVRSEYMIAKRDKNLSYLEQIKRSRHTARIRATLLGLKFSVNRVLDSGEEREEAEIVYETNIFGLNGPRRMNVNLLSGDKKMLLRNKSPQWNEDSQSYVLNFSGRVSMASVKNFQVIHEDDRKFLVMLFVADYIALQFGKVSPNIFTMDYRYPLNALQAFGICLTSFDSKLACE